MGVAAAVIGGVIAAGGAAYAAKSSSDAQSAAANANKKNIRNTNQLNYNLFQESRGSKGNAVLPLYMTMPDGSPFEGKLAKDLMGVYNNSQVPMSDYKAAVARMAPAQAGAESMANGIFNGGVQRQMQTNFAPVAAGRVAFTRQSAMDALNKTLAQIDASQAARGFTGDSLGNRMLKFGAQKQMGDSLANVNIANLNDYRNIADQALQLKLSNLSLPSTMAGQAANILSLPTTAYTGNVNTSLVPLNFLKIGTTPPFVNQNLPVVQPSVGTGQIIGQTASAVGGTALQYMLQQQQQQNYMAQLSKILASNNAPAYQPAAIPMPAPVAPSVDTSGANYGTPLPPPSADTDSAAAMSLYSGD